MTGQQQGPYVVVTVAGYGDGRPAVATGHRRRPIFWPAAQLAAEILAQLTMPPDVTCSLPEWRCWPRPPRRRGPPGGRGRAAAAGVGGAAGGAAAAGATARAAPRRGPRAWCPTGPGFPGAATPPGSRPPRWHGTFIASLIAGHGSGPDRAGGVIGVAPAARILAVRVILDADEPGFPVYNATARYEDAIARGIRYAVRQGVAVINMSLGSASGTPQLRQAIGYAIARGVVVVASAGNDGTAPGRSSPYSYPASFTGVISVAAVGTGHRPAPFSDRNASVVVSAPGVDGTRAAPRGGYLGSNGT